MHIPGLLSLLYLSGISLATSSTGCGHDLPSHFPKPGTSKALHLQSLSREYRLYIPSNYDTNTATPVYFSFHGATKNMTEEETLSQFSNPQFNPHGIAIYPNSQNGYWLSNPHANTASPNDLDFIDTLLTHLETQLCIDKTRIYSAGKSNGGGFTSVLACNVTVGRRFAAFAAVSGAWYDTDDIPGVGPCDPAPREEGYPFLEFHGTMDTTAPIDGSNPNVKHPKIPVINFLEGWAERNGCQKGASWSRNETVFTDPVVRKVDWDCGGKKGIVRHFREEDNGHCWPSMAPNDDFEGMVSQCPMGKYVFNATEYIFEFFKGYKLNSA